jgi:aspartate/methionine/tyrosine aminotransferase
MSYRKFNLPIIADEIYGGCVFDGVFTSISSVSGDVPVLVVGG